MRRDDLALESAAGHVLVDRARGLLARGDRVDQKAGAVREIARDEHAGRRRHQRVAVDFRPAGAHLLEVAPSVREKSEVRRLTNGHEHRVTFDDHDVVIVVDRSKPAGLVVDTQAPAELHAANLAAWIANHLERSPAVHASDAFLVPFADLHRVGGHLLERFERGKRHAAGSLDPGRGARRVVGRLTKDGARHVVRDVAAADHDHVSSELERFVERHRAEQVDAAHDTGAALARETELSRLLRSDGDDHRVVVATQVGERHFLPDRHAAPDLDA